MFHIRNLGHVACLLVAQGALDLAPMHAQASSAPPKAEQLVAPTGRPLPPVHDYGEVDPTFVAGVAPMLSNQIWVITGAARGIGLAMTQELLRRQAIVFAGVFDPSDADELKALQKANGDKLHLLPLDVTDDASVKAFAKGITADHVDALINNAGVNNDKGRKLHDESGQELLATLNVNTVGPLRVSQALLALLHAAKAPRIANISSIMGSIGDNAIGSSPMYRISKSAVNMLGKNLALEEPWLVVLSMHPGWVKTKMGGDRAPISTQDAAQGLINVISRATISHTGQYLKYTGQHLPW